MPQMSPLMWLYLFMFFTLVYLMSLIKTYFTPKTMSEEKKIEASSTSQKLNWKW